MDMAKLANEIDRYGPAAYLITIGDGPTPHVSPVEVALLDGRCRVPVDVDSRAVRNATACSAVTLHWPGTEAVDGYSLIVDGTATVGGGSIDIAPTRAVRHKPVRELRPDRPEGICGHDCIAV